jgi:hypothetical protein
MSVQKIIAVLALPALLLAPTIAGAGEIDIRTNNARVTIDSDDSVYINSRGSKLSTLRTPYRSQYPLRSPYSSYSSSTRGACSTQQSTYSSQSSKGSSYTRSTTYSSICR